MIRDSAHKFILDVRRVERELGHFPTRAEYVSEGKYAQAIAILFGNWSGVERAIKREKEAEEKDEKREPNILLFDLETAPMRVFSFGLFDQTIGLNQIDQDWHLLSFAAKWLDKPKIFFESQAKEKDLRNDTRILKALWKLLDQADVVITQNGKAFDEKVANARFIIQGLKPPKPFQHIDTKQLAKRKFRFTSNKLEYMAKALKVKHKKLTDRRFAGFDLWAEVMKGNQKAWAEMKAYNIADVLALEGVYKKLRSWGPAPGVDLNVFHGDSLYRCPSCQGTDIIRRGWRYLATGKFKQYTCNACNAWFNDRGAGNNTLSLKKKMSLKTVGR